MSITKSYNKYNNIYYAYETTYEWDEKLGRKVQKKVCIGKYDNETGEVIPNAKRGRPSKGTVIANQSAAKKLNYPRDQERLNSELTSVLDEMKLIRTELEKQRNRLSILESKISIL